jgi:hypothetical protein
MANVSVYCEFRRSQVERAGASRFFSLWMGSLLLVGVGTGQAASVVLTVDDADGIAGRCAAPVTAAVDLSRLSDIAPPSSQFLSISLSEAGPDRAAPIPAQFEPDAPNSRRGTLRCLMPPGPAGKRRFALTVEATASAPIMGVQRDKVSGQFELSEAGKPVLRYNYQTNEPGALLAKVAPGNLKYARARSDYIHPLYGLDGTELTKDWSVDHPHHRGIYWAWPEVDYHGERGDLHALQRVFARPTGKCLGTDGPVCAVIDAENLWLWEDQVAIVRERALIRAWRAGPAGRFIDLEFHFTALKNDVALARRETDKYGGLNLRLSAVQEQQIVFHSDPAGTALRQAWADLSGVFPGGKLSGLAVFQSPANADYPGDWIKYPELNWFQPTFPAAGTRYVLRKGQPLILRFRLLIHPGKAEDALLADSWTAFARPVVATTDNPSHSTNTHP